MTFGLTHNLFPTGFGRTFSSDDCEVLQAQRQNHRGPSPAYQREAQTDRRTGFGQLRRAMGGIAGDVTSLLDARLSFDFDESGQPGSLFGECARMTIVAGKILVGRVDVEEGVPLWIELAELFAAALGEDGVAGIAVACFNRLSITFTDPQRYFRLRLPSP
jgi:hypothetical protein